MEFRALRWATVWLPVLFIIVIEIVEDFILEPLLGQWTGHFITFGVVAVGAVGLSFIVFRAVEEAESRLRQQNRDLAAHNEISQVVSASLELDAVLVRALEKVLDVVETEAGEIFLLDEPRQELVFKVHCGLFPKAFQEITRFPVNEGFPGLVAATGGAIVVTDLAADPRLKRRAVVAQGFQTMACVPLRAKDRVVGVMNVADRHKVYTAEQESLLAAIGNQIGMAIENARLYARVQETASHLNALIESSGDAMITIDLDGRITSWNRGAEEIYGWSKEEAIGQVIPMVPEHLRQEALEGIAGMAKEGETIHSVEVQRLHKSGKVLDVVVTASPLRDASGKIIGILGISKDITEKKRLEQELLRQQRALAVLEERERLARELHDSLGQILGYVNTQTQAARELLSRDQAAAADTHLRRLAEVAQDAHADVREYILSLQASALTEQGFLPALEEYLQRFSQNNGIQTELIASDELADVAFGPNVEAQLMRIVQEALTNVRKHARAQHVWITFEVDSGQAQVSIEDDGHGFDPARMSPEDGPHFGLRIMQERAEEFGGSIQVQSMPDQGTKVVVKVPLRREEGD
ncbi:MAG: PAS domain S-box protein [Anaerolineae bacterium]